MLQNDSLVNSEVPKRQYTVPQPVCPVPPSTINLPTHFYHLPTQRVFDYSERQAIETAWKRAVTRGERPALHHIVLYNVIRNKPIFHGMEPVKRNQTVYHFSVGGHDPYICRWRAVNQLYTTSLYGIHQPDRVKRTLSRIFDDTISPDKFFTITRDILTHIRQVSQSLV